MADENALQYPGRWAAEAADRTAIVMAESGESMTFAELDESADRLAQALRARGVVHGDRIVVWADTCLEVLPLFVALAKLGAVFAPLNARFGTAEAAVIVKMAQPRMLVADAGHLQGAIEIASELGIERVGSLLAPDPGSHVMDLRPNQLAACPEAIDEPALAETDPHVIFFTSGSEGQATESVVISRPNIKNTPNGLAASSPQTLTSIPAAFATRDTELIC